MKVKDLLRKLDGVDPELDVKIWNGDQEFTFDVETAMIAYQDGSDHTEPIEGFLNVLTREFENVESLTLDDIHDTMKWWLRSFFLIIK